MAVQPTAAATRTTKPSKKRRLQDGSTPPLKRVKEPVAPYAVPPARRGGRGARPSISIPCSNVVPTSRLEVFVFGDGSAGELGLGTKDAVEVDNPRLNHNLDPKSVGVMSLAAGGMHGVALTHDNKILTWGVNDLNALGRDTTWEGKMREIDGRRDADSDESEPDLNPLESTPIAVPADRFPAGTKFVQVAAGDSATFILTDSGLVYGWGTFRDSKGVFGFYVERNGDLIKVQREPMLIPDLKRIVQLRSGNDFCIALDTEGNVFSWGTGEQGQLGRRLIQRHLMKALLPTRVALPRKRILSIHTGADHVFAIDSNGNTWAWGSNNFGQTGVTDGVGQDGSIIIPPRKVASLTGKRMRMIEGGTHHSVGGTQDGECLVWGRIDGAQMGLDIKTLPLDDAQKVMTDYGRPRILLQPTSLALVECVFAAAGSDHNIVITADGKAYSWGFNANYQCGVGNADDDILVPTLIESPQFCDRRFSWAGAGGQYSMLAATWKGVS